MQSGDKQPYQVYMLRVLIAVNELSDVGVI